MLKAEPSVGIGQSVEIAFLDPHRFDVPVGLAALQTMKAPDFRKGCKAEQRNCLPHIPSRDNHHASVTAANDLLQDLFNPRIRESLVTLFFKWWQGAVIIEQEQRPLRLSHLFQKSFTTKL